MDIDTNPESGDTTAETPGSTGVDAPVVGLQPGQLTTGWRWVLALGWSVCIPVLITLADAANSFGKPTWWLSSSAMPAWWTPAPFLAPLLVTMAATGNWRRWPIAASVGVVGLGLTALFDRTRSPSGAVGEAIMAAAALASSIACLAGRVRRPEAR